MPKGKGDFDAGATRTPTLPGSTRVHRLITGLECLEQYAELPWKDDRCGGTVFMTYSLFWSFVIVLSFIFVFFEDTSGVTRDSTDSLLQCWTRDTTDTHPIFVVLRSLLREDNPRLLRDSINNIVDPPGEHSICPPRKFCQDNSYHMSQKGTLEREFKRLVWPEV